MHGCARGVHSITLRTIFLRNPIAVHLGFLKSRLLRLLIPFRKQKALHPFQQS
jgi:hypothetical protein